MHKTFGGLIMLYVDYTFDMNPGGIILDEDLTLNKLPGFQPGDIFVLEKTASGRLTLTKKAGIQKFILDSVAEDIKEKK